MNKTALGDNPLSKGIFNKTEASSKQTVKGKQESITKRKVSRKKIQEKIFLTEEAQKENVNLRLPIDLNDWLNNLLRDGKRKHGRKIPKEVWVQAALELFQAVPVNWLEIASEEQLRETLKILESRLKNQET